jgi:hypothetical protein
MQPDPTMPPHKKSSPKSVSPAKNKHKAALTVKGSTTQLNRNRTGCSSNTPTLAQPTKAQRKLSVSVSKHQSVAYKIHTRSSRPIASPKTERIRVGDHDPRKMTKVVLTTMEPIGISTTGWMYDKASITTVMPKAIPAAVTLQSRYS